jgi:type IV pilus assembly protein PilB
MKRKLLGEMLVEAGFLDETRLHTALAEQRTRGQPLGRILIEMKLISEEDLVHVLSRQLDIPVMDLANVKVSPEVLALVPRELAQQRGILPVSNDGATLVVVLGDPTDERLLDELATRSHLKIQPQLAVRAGLEKAISLHYGVAAAPTHVASDAAVSPGMSQSIDALQERINDLESLVEREYEVLHRLSAVLVAKGILTKDELEKGPK